MFYYRFGAENNNVLLTLIRSSASLRGINRAGTVLVLYPSYDPIELQVFPLPYARYAWVCSDYARKFNDGEQPRTLE